MILAISVMVSSFSLIASMSRMSKMGVIFRGDGVGGWLAVWFSLSWQRLMFELEFEHNVMPGTFRIRKANETKYRKWHFIVWVVETLLNQFKHCFMWGLKSNWRIRTYFIDLDFILLLKCSLGSQNLLLSPFIKYYPCLLLLLRILIETT